MFPRIIMALALCALSGCVSGIHTQVVAPPKSATAARLRRVAVFPFSGQAGEQITAEVESILAQATENGQPYFTVVDRATLQQALNELKLHQTGLVDSRSVARLGKFVGADGIYAGSVFVPPVARLNSNQERMSCNRSAHPERLFSACASISKYTVSCLVKVAHFTIVPRLIAVETAQVVYQPTLTGQAEGASCSDQGGELDDATLVGNAASQALLKLREDVTPHTRTLDLQLKTEVGDLDGPSRARFEGGMAFARADRMDRACTTWRQLLEENPRSLALGFDVAICDESTGQLDPALRRLAALDQGLQQPDATLNAALKRVRAELQSQRASQAPIQTGNKPVIRSGSGRAVQADP